MHGVQGAATDAAPAVVAVCGTWAEQGSIGEPEVGGHFAVQGCGCSCVGRCRGACIPAWPLALRCLLRRSGATRACRERRSTCCPQLLRPYTGGTPLAGHNCLWLLSLTLALSSPAVSILLLLLPLPLPNNSPLPVLMRSLLILRGFKQGCAHCRWEFGKGKVWNGQSTGRAAPAHAQQQRWMSAIQQLSSAATVMTVAWRSLAQGTN